MAVGTGGSLETCGSGEVPGSPVPGSAGRGVPGLWTLENGSGGRSRSLPSGAAAGARGGTGTGTGAPVAALPPTRGTGTMVSPGPPLPSLLLSLSEGADRDGRHGTRWARDPPVPVAVRVSGLSLPKGGTRPLGGGPRGTFRVPVCSGRACPPLAVPRGPGASVCALTPQCSCARRSPSSDGSVPTSPRFPVPVVPVCPLLAVPTSLRCSCPRGQALSPGW